MTNRAQTPSLAGRIGRFFDRALPAPFPWTTILPYGIGVAAAAMLLEWLEYQYTVRIFSTEIYIVAIAFLFTGLGIWVGLRLTRPPNVAAPAFERNDKARHHLGISDRELEVLELLAQGLSNKEIGEGLFVSPNTVKTHLAKLYGKLEVSRRTQAVQRARELRLIP